MPRGKKQLDMEKAKHLRESGCSFRNIAARLGVSHVTISRRLAEKMRPASRAAIPFSEQLRSVSDEALKKLRDALKHRLTLLYLEFELRNPKLTTEPSPTPPGPAERIRLKRSEAFRNETDAALQKASNE